MSEEQALKPTARCKLWNTRDAIVLVQACLQNKAKMIQRRPHDRERAYLIKPGNAFVYMENESGIKRWTDGIQWSPSRILGNYLVYRELDKSLSPAEKKKAVKKSNRRDTYSPRATQPGQPYSLEHQLTKAEERQLVGSLNDSYQFKEGGLIKKTISMAYLNNTVHVVWYFDIASYTNRLFSQPDELFGPIGPLYPELTEQSSYRQAIDADGYETAERRPVSSRSRDDSAPVSPAGIGSDPRYMYTNAYQDHSMHGQPANYELVRYTARPEEAASSSTGYYSQQPRYSSLPNQMMLTQHFQQSYVANHYLPSPHANGQLHYPTGSYYPSGSPVQAENHFHSRGTPQHMPQYQSSETPGYAAMSFEQRPADNAAEPSTEYQATPQQ